MSMSDLVLNYLIDRISGLALPSFIFILASWRVSRLRNLTMENYVDRVDESVSDTIKEQLTNKVITPLFNSNGVELPNGKSVYQILETLVPTNNVDLLATIYMDLAELGINSSNYVQCLELVNLWWGGG